MALTCSDHRRVEVLDAESSADRSEAMALIDVAMEARSLSLEGVFPLLLGPGVDSRRVVVREEGAIAAHAASRSITAQVAGGGEISLVNVGCVCTRESARGRGYASLLVRALMASAEARGADLAILWAARPTLYERLGFVEAGVETSFHVTREMLAGDDAASIRPIHDADVDELLAMRRHDHVHLRRSDDDMRRLLAIPRSHAFTVVDGAGPVGYLVVGKGLDYPGMVAEWAMPAAALPGALRAVLDESGARETLVFGPARGEWIDVMSARGSASDEHALAMFALLDRSRLCARLGLVDDGALDDHAFLEHVLGHPDVDAEPRVPFYVWGLDSN